MYEIRQGRSAPSEGRNSVRTESVDVYVNVYVYVHNQYRNGLE